MLIYSFAPPRFRWAKFSVRVECRAPDTFRSYPWGKLSFGRKNNHMIGNTRLFIRQALAAAGFLLYNLATVAMGATPFASTAGMSFSSETRTLSGDKRAHGTGYSMAVTRALSGGVRLGIKCAGAGLAGASSTVYRLGAGPELSVGLWQSGAASLAVLNFRESAEDQRGGHLYSASGYGFVLGWNRITPLAGGAELLFGGFVALYRHSQQDVGPAFWNSLEPKRRSQAGPYIGDRGVELALRFPL